MKNLRREFAIAVAASEAAIRVDTDELTDAIATIAEVCKKHGWILRVFDVAAGLQHLNGSVDAGDTGKKTATSETAASLLQALGGGGGGSSLGATSVMQQLNDFWNEPAQVDAKLGDIVPSVLVFKNFHLGFEGRREQVSAIVQHIVSDKLCDTLAYNERKDSYDLHELEPDNDTGKFIVGLMPAEAMLPDEVAPLFRRIVHEIPDEAELLLILNGIVSTGNDDDDADNTSGLSPEDRKRACRFALGLTRLQAEGVFSACMVHHKRIVPEYIWKAKSDILNKEGLVTLYDGKEKFKEIVGLNGVKFFLQKLLTPNEYDDGDPDVRAKGVLFVGPPGTGKSAAAKATGNELGMPTLMVNPGNWMGSHVGESEAKTRKGFQILRAHAPCIAIVDEVEKVMPKSRNNGGDSGVSARMEGTFLTNMNDIQELIFWVFTANDVRGMHEAFFRAERVDGVFYVRLPGEKQRAGLWQLYGKKFFPKETTVAGKVVDFPGHLPTDTKSVLKELSAAKKVVVADWAARFTLALMCLEPGERAAARAKIAEIREDVEAAIQVIDDNGWSPAEIRACCRLARRLNEPLHVTQHRIRPVSQSSPKVIEYLEKWAASSALDAETGELYRLPAQDTENVTKTTSSQRVRRTVRTLD